MKQRRMQETYEGIQSRGEENKIEVHWKSVPETDPGTDLNRYTVESYRSKMKKENPKSNQIWILEPNGHKPKAAKTKRNANQIKQSPNQQINKRKTYGRTKQRRIGGTYKGLQSRGERATWLYGCMAI